jgi:DNA processing protein
MQESLALMALLHAKHIGPRTARVLLAHYQTAEAIFRHKNKPKPNLPGIGPVVWESIIDKSIHQAAEKEWARMEKNKISFLDFRDDAFPQALNHCPDGPLMLFYSGKPIPKSNRILAIVGTRSASEKNISFTRTLIAKLKPYNPIIVSGLAHGIDICAHRSAIDHGLATFACLAHGIRDCYPAYHAKTRRLMELGGGGCLTEFWSNTSVQKGNFLSRNRIIAGVSVATLVIASGVRGGAMSTARLAREYNREVFAVPGGPYNPTHAGCNLLIKNHIAQLLDDPQDLIKSLGWKEKPEYKSTQIDLFRSKKPEHHKIMNFLSDGPKMLDLIALNTGLNVSHVATLLFEMEMLGIVRPLAGKRFGLV